MAKVVFKKMEVPAIALSPRLPELAPELFRQRFARLERAREEAQLDCLLIYADREHAANLGWLTDFTPCFEEALWVQASGKQPSLLAGNECLTYAQHSLKIPARLCLYQDFSLPDQDRSKNIDLIQALRECGLSRGMKTGLIGWKPFKSIDLPYWIVRAVEELTGCEPVNAADLLMDAEYGLKSTLEPEMIRFCEYSGALTSQGIYNLILGMRTGISEREAAAHLVSYGLEHSCHPMVNFGSSIPSGLKSPRNNQAHKGHYAQAAFGLIGGLTCRAGYLSSNSQGSESDHYVEIVQNYLEVIHAWYGKLAVGIPAAFVFEAALSAKDQSWDFALNPGHLIHLEEWLASPFYQGSKIELKSGMAIQADIIPLPRAGNAVINMEDGCVLADADLRDQLTRLDSLMMDRVAKRRALMELLGYNISADVLPLSNIAGAFFPFWFEPAVLGSFS